MNTMQIDLNLDAGESSEALKNGSEEALYHFVTSVNIACGGHAGDEATMSKTVELAQKFSLSVGAHPSFPDRQNFGREVLEISKAELIDSLTDQIETLKAICDRQSVCLNHVKPHGALYNLAATDFEASQAIIEAVRRVDSGLVIVGLAGSQFLQWCRNAGIKSVAEAFTDRLYEDNGHLRSRKFPDALIESPELAAQQAVQIASCQTVRSINGKQIEIHAETLCVHGDSAQSLANARAVHAALRAAGVVLRKFIP